MDQTADTASRDEGDIGLMQIIKESLAKAKKNNKAAMPFTTAAPITFVMQPLVVGRTLMQIGFEPVEPRLGRSLFGKEFFFHPNIFSYLNHLRQEKGLVSLWRGLTPLSLNMVISAYAEGRLANLLRLNSPYQSPDSKRPLIEKSIAGFLHEVAVVGASKSVSVVITNPLYVVMVRTISSLVSDDECYSSLYSTVKELYNTEGISGFFCGLVPRWLGEMITIAVGYSLVVATKELLKFFQAEDIERNTNSVGTLIQYGVASMTYRFTLVSTIAAASCPGLHLGFPNYQSWKDIYRQLQGDGQLNRGASYFFRRATI